MKCPACGQEMVKKNFGVDVDVCENGCKGIWFDQGELTRLDEKNEGIGAALQAALRWPRKNDAHRPPLTCPKCSIPMHAHKFKRAKEVNVERMLPVRVVLSRFGRAHRNPRPLYE